MDASAPQSEKPHGDNRRWHLGKVIDAPMIIVLLLQTIGVIWAGAQLVKTVELQGTQILSIDLKVNKLIEAQSGAATMLLRMQMVESELAAVRLKTERLELEMVRSGRIADSRK